MEYGCYDLDGFAKVDINNNLTAIEFELTAIHELVHKNLSENSTYGLILILIKLILKSDNLSKANRSRLERILNTLLPHMLQVQESIAVFVELIYAKTFYGKEYSKRLNLYKNNKHYYEKCKFKEIEVLLECEYKTIIPLLIDLGMKAMNINLSTLKILDKKLDKIIINQEKVLKINPNVRFRKLVNYINENIQLNEIKSSLIEELCINTNIEFQQDVGHQVFIKWAKENIISPLGLRDFRDYLILNNKIIETQDFINSIYAYTSEIRYQIHHIKNSFDFKEKNTENNLMVIYKYVKGLYSIASVDVLLGNIYIYSCNSIKELILKEQIIYCERYYYNNIIRDNDYLKKHRIFVNLCGFDEFCEQFINQNSDSDKFFHFHQINDNVFCVFIKGIGRTYFLQVFPVAQFKYIYEGILDDYKYINIDSNTLLDDIFYCDEGDWCKFEDILSYIMQRKILSFNATESLSLGHRIKLDIS